MPCHDHGQEREVDWVDRCLPSPLWADWTGVDESQCREQSLSTDTSSEVAFIRFVGLAHVAQGSWSSGGILGFRSWAMILEMVQRMKLGAGSLHWHNCAASLSQILAAASKAKPDPVPEFEPSFTGIWASTGRKKRPGYMCLLTASSVSNSPFPPSLSLSLSFSHPSLCSFALSLCHACTQRCMQTCLYLMSESDLILFLLRFSICSLRPELPCHSDNVLSG